MLSASSAGSSVEHSIPGDYQLRALTRGWRLQRAWHRARLDLVKSVLPPDGDALALDAAGGSGIVSWRFPAAGVVTADFRVGACQAVRAHKPGARVVTADVMALPFRSRVFSRLYFLEAIEHLTEAEGAQSLAEVHRVARPRAKCLITTPNYRSHWVLLERLIDFLHLTPRMGASQHRSRYDGRALARAAEAAGWRILSGGSFNLVAPLVGLFSARGGSRAVAIEASRLRRGGALLYLLCERTDAT
jgi:ubiquinone/menaquinone biosynthesis C-methylase UbiE